MTTMLRAILLLNLALLGLPGVAAAQDLQATVTVIHATKQGKEVDPALEPLKRELSAFSFSSYKLIQTRHLALAFGKKGEVKLPDDRVLEILPKKRDPDGKLRVQLKLAELLDTTYAIAEGGTIIVGGPKWKDGVLILAVTQTAVRK